MTRPISQLWICVTWVLPYILLSLGHFLTKSRDWNSFSGWSIILHSFKIWSRMRTFLAPVRTCKLQSSWKFAYSLKIVCIQLSIFITFVSNCSFYRKQSARARSWLLCAHARSHQAENLHASLNLAILNFHNFCLRPLLLWWENSSKYPPSIGIII